MSIDALLDNPPEFTLPKKLANKSLTTHLLATLTAGIWVESQVSEAIKNPRFTLEGKGGADVKSVIDERSEDIMHQMQKKLGYRGWFFGEEGLAEQVNGGSDIITSVDGIDGTEVALRLTQGPKGAYGVLNSAFRIEKNVLEPVMGIAYFPRDGRGYACSVGERIAVEFKARKRTGMRDQTYTVDEMKELQPFLQDRLDVKAKIGLWDTTEEDMRLFWNVFTGFNKRGSQNCLTSSGSCEDFAQLVGNYPGGRQDKGPSAYVGCKTVNLHDIGPWASIIMMLGGVVGDRDGNVLWESPEFIKYEGGWDAVLKNKDVAEVDIGWMIAAHNKHVYNAVRSDLNRTSEPVR